MNAFLHHLGYDFRTGIRDRSQLLMNYLMPLVFFLLVGGLMVSVNPGFREQMLPAMTLFAILSSTLLSMPANLVNAREAGVFRSFRINGVPSGALLSIPPLGGAVHMAVVAAIIGFLGPLMYGGAAPASVAGYAAAGLLAYAALAGAGALIGVAAASNRSTILLGQLFYLPSIMLGGLMVPAAALPPVLARVSMLLPASHAMRMFTALGMRPGSGPFPWTSVAALGAGTVAAFTLAALLFQWDSRQSQPGRRTYLALLGLLPYVAAAAVG